MSKEQEREFIIAELNSLPRKEIERFGAKIVCPYHNDTNPSMNVNLDVDEKTAPLGWARCWSCKTSKPWSDLADTLGLRKYNNKKKRSSDYVDPDRYRDGLLSTEDDKDVEDGFQKDLDDLQFFDFQMETWREIPCDFLAKVGCKFAYKEYNDTFYVWMPVLINKKLRGYVKAELEKPEPVMKKDKKGELYSVRPPSYLNAPGKWSAKYGLLFYDYAVKLMLRKELKTIVLCEGPRDGLRLLRYGIPAMPVLGAGNWNEDKRFQLEKTGAENIIIFMDGDAAGHMATKIIYRDIKQHFNTKFMSLWKYATPLVNKRGKPVLDEKGETKMLEYDPFSCPKKFLRQVKNNLI